MTSSRAERPADRRFSAIDPPPIFIGGTGRSGTTITGRLLGQHPDYAVIPIEAKFHVIKGGLPGVMRGQVTPAAFAERMRTELFTGGSSNDRRGLRAIIAADRLDRELELFLADADEDPVRAARRLAHRMFVQYARRSDRRGWVEMTPRNVLHAKELGRMFPELKLVHTIRDGRDVASSLVGLGWIEDPEAAIDWWEARVLHGWRMSQALSSDQVHVLRFEQFMATRRKEAFAELLAFLGWADEPAVNEYFETTMATRRANVGRWAEKLPEDVRHRVDARYGEALERLRAAGAPTPEDTPARSPDAG